MEVGITGKSTSASWYEIWEAAAALIAMCVRASGKGGKAFGIGKFVPLVSSLRFDYSRS